MTAHDGLGEAWIAIGLDLTLVSAAEGRRRTALLLSERLSYRPNWGLPGMTGTERRIATGRARFRWQPRAQPQWALIVSIARSSASRARRLTVPVVRIQNVRICMF